MTSQRLTSTEERSACDALCAFDPRIHVHSVFARGNWRPVPQSIIVVPASDEASGIRACLEGLATSVRSATGHATIMLVVNNTVDDTERLALERVEAAALNAVVIAMEIPRSGGVGLARAAGFSLAASLWRGEPCYLTTDADSVVDTNWLARSQQWLRRCDAVCGNVSPAPGAMAHLPLSIGSPGALEGRYWQLVMEIDSLLDPDPVNPWPHHGRASGASLAVRSGAYHAIGGFSPVPCDEDTDLVRRLKVAGYRVKYADDVKVDTSCRLDGRAPGGMADALARRCRDLDSVADSVLEPAATHVLRVRARRQCRESLQYGQPLDTLARFLDVDPALLSRAQQVDDRSVWPCLELLSPRLRRKRLRPSQLPREIEILERDLCLLKTLRSQPIHEPLRTSGARAVGVRQTACPEPPLLVTRFARQIGDNASSPCPSPKESCHELKED